MISFSERHILYTLLCCFKGVLDKNAVLSYAQQSRNLCHESSIEEKYWKPQTSYNLHFPKKTRDKVKPEVLNYKNHFNECGLILKILAVWLSQLGHWTWNLEILSSSPTLTTNWILRQVVPGLTAWLSLYIASWHIALCQLGFLTSLVHLLYSVDICVVGPWSAYDRQCTGFKLLIKLMMIMMFCVFNLLLNYK